LRRIFVFFIDPPLDLLDRQSKLRSDRRVRVAGVMPLQSQFSPVVVQDIRRSRCPLDPVESLRGRVHLIVVFGVRKGRKLVHVVSKTRRLAGHIDEAIFDGCGLRVQTHLLVALRNIALDGVQAFADQLLDELGAGRPVLDQHHGRLVRLSMRADSTAFSGCCGKRLHSFRLP
jgi:hypothetical protein